MKYRYLILMALLNLVCMQVWSQREIGLRIAAGASVITDLYYLSYNYDPEPAKGSFAAQFGAYYKQPLGKVFFLESGTMLDWYGGHDMHNYTQRWALGSTYTFFVHEEAQVSVNMLTLPLYFGFRIAQFRMSFGPQVGLCLSSRGKRVIQSRGSDGRYYEDQTMVIDEAFFSNSLFAGGSLYLSYPVWKNLHFELQVNYLKSHDPDGARIVSNLKRAAFGLRYNFFGHLHEE